MTQSTLASVGKTCPTCGAPNNIVTNEIRPFPTINCSRCGGAIADPRTPRAAPVQRTPDAPAQPRKAS